MRINDCAFLTFISLWGIADCFMNSRPKPLLKTPAASLQKQRALVDPNLIIQHVTDATTTSAIMQNAHLDAVLSTVYSSGVAHGHSDPWFGAPDPFLSAGKSIVPPGSSGLSIPSDMPQVAEYFAKKGWPILESSSIAPEGTLPGFSSTGGILQARDPSIPPTDTPEVFAAQVEWSANFMNVALKLPLAALFYVMVEFFFLRSNVDIYKSEIERESATTLWADTLATGFVRLIAMSIVAIATLTIFG
mmetsp:Transcript_13982/g.18228  ORF Transcript_13982/g.18228 Transcript_13982/m.18228 type:complete len:247 (-) Transcript_13982:341-1081(-)|eukprot:CAMPEP_0198148306 /NCGR_PEP_ID=MMETSP1443-20131203/40864_1 /TAXON_ID=186043 /ORGANISM="Entomoneis sp., Strain CCMP2396" /LENGTH=246 /DNA_ID=CAMNT_0043812961 /DNA_START=150 /DNA_END=890 /DNA_ORIENTATION=-